MLLLVLSLLHFSPAMAVQNLDASMTATVHTSRGNVMVYGSAEIDQLDPPSAAHPHSVLIPLVIVPVYGMSASMFGVMPVLRGASFFNASEFPIVSVENVQIYNSNIVVGILRMKGHPKVISGTWKTLPNKRITIDLMISLNDFSFAHKVWFYTIDDAAKVQVEMENPFESP